MKTKVNKKGIVLIFGYHHLNAPKVSALIQDSQKANLQRSVRQIKHFMFNTVVDLPKGLLPMILLR